MRSRSMLTKSAARRLQRDYIPDGKLVDINTLKFRRTREDEVYQCCYPTAYDPQSGNIYCGGIAEWVANVDGGGVVCLCGERGHVPPPHTIISS